MSGRARARTVALLAEAVVTSLAVRASLRTRGVRRTLALVHGPPRRATPPSADPALPAAIDLAVRRVGAHRPFAYACLPRSITTALMLRRRGIVPQHRLGVQTADRERLVGHAWVELDGQPLGEGTDGLRGFRVVPLEAFLATSGASPGRGAPERTA